MQYKDEEFGHEQSLRLIQDMIATAKQEQKDDGKGWIIWGWMIFCASLLTYLNIEFRFLEKIPFFENSNLVTTTFFFWNVFGLLSLVLMLIAAVRSFTRKAAKVRTYIQEIFKWLDIGFFISLALIIVSINVGVPPGKGFSLLLGLYGFWILIYGTLLNFRPSIIGAFFTWVLAFVSLFQDHFSTVMLIHAVAVLGGYIIPGYLANKEFKQSKKTTGV